MLPLITSIGGFIVDGIGKIFGDKGEREKAGHAETMAKLGLEEAVQSQFADEFKSRGTRFMFDSAIDGLNRIPRPLFALQAISLPFFAYLDPEEFNKFTDAIESIPDYLWEAYIVIVMFFFGARELAHLRNRPKKRTIVAPVVDDEPNPGSNPWMSASTGKPYGI